MFKYYLIYTFLLIKVMVLGQNSLEHSKKVQKKISNWSWGFSFSQDYCMHWMKDNPRFELDATKMGYTDKQFIELRKKYDKPRKSYALGFILQKTFPNTSAFKQVLLTPMWEK